MLTANQISDGTKSIIEYMKFWYEKPDSLNNTYLFKISDKNTEFERKATICKAGNERFHFSFDWLIPVVEKIEDDGYTVKIIATCCTITDIDDINIYYSYNVNSETKIEAIFTAVSNFLEYYNRK